MFISDCKEIDYGEEMKICLQFRHLVDMYRGGVDVKTIGYITFECFFFNQTFQRKILVIRMKKVGRRQGSWSGGGSTLILVSGA